MPALQGKRSIRVIPARPTFAGAVEVIVWVVLGGVVRPNPAEDIGQSSLHTGSLAGRIQQNLGYPKHRCSGGTGSSLVGTGSSLVGTGSSPGSTGRSENRFAADTAGCRTGSGNRQDSSRIAA